MHDGGEDSVAGVGYVSVLPVKANRIHRTGIIPVRQRRAGRYRYRLINSAVTRGLTAGQAADMCRCCSGMSWISCSRGRYERGGRAAENAPGCKSARLKTAVDQKVG